MKIPFKILKAAGQMGLNYSEIPNMLKMSERIPLATWAINKVTKRSLIYLNPRVAKLPVKEIELVIRHEVLHYAGYNEVEGLSDHELLNITLDITINRILEIAYSARMKKLCSRIYPKETQRTTLALAQPQLTRYDSPQATGKLAELWQEIWCKEPITIPSPVSLYYQLFERGSEKNKSPWGSSGNASGGQSGTDKAGNGGSGESGDKDKGEKAKTQGTGSGEEDKDKDEKSKSQGTTSGEEEKENEKDKKGQEQQEEEVSFREIPEDIGEVNDGPMIKETERQLGEMKNDIWGSRSISNSYSCAKAFSDMTSKFFRKMFLKAQGGLDIQQVSRFIESLNLHREMEDALDPLIQEASTSSRRQCYPYQLSRLGTIYIACGISDILPFFWNRTPENQKISVAIYMDTSPSMDSFKEQEVWLVDRLKESFPAKMFVFSGSVEEVSTSDFAQGTYPQGSSTSFNAVVEHFLEQKKEEFALVFTDGQSAVSSENELLFKKSRKKLFAIYFSDSIQRRNITSSLDNIGTKTTTLYVPEKDRKGPTRR